jgi:hypothetical protein
MKVAVLRGRNARECHVSLCERMWLNMNHTFCIVLYWRGGHCCPMHCDLFKIYCAPPNLGIRTWICRLNFAQRPIFSGSMFFNEPEKSYLGPSAKSPSRRTCTQDFYVLKKSIYLSRVSTREPWISRRARCPETTEADWIIPYSYILIDPQSVHSAANDAEDRRPHHVCILTSHVSHPFCTTLNLQEFISPSVL